jgi:hypothetical protein
MAGALSEGAVGKTIYQRIHENIFDLNCTRGHYNCLGFCHRLNASTDTLKLARFRR